MINAVKEKVLQFLQDTLEIKELGEGVKIVGITKIGNGWVAEAEVVERERTLPGHRVFKTEHYIVKLNKDLEAYSFRQANRSRPEEMEESE
ncbi:gas vesicle protein GvpO [Dictyobacter formicarum]|uniref:Gas vesicle protein GvpR n=1 Tax=Dictyobacter formicarum TaxID=2778368 RepID=A0ABQ3VBW3_9CHLR|nr:gas vesicle protein GvpO [Dictyobacter formicarum]GHO83153.1 hypothetical protein KSZ_11590 [Dictyobacter formicarum]